MARVRDNCHAVFTRRPSKAKSRMLKVCGKRGRSVVERSDRRLNKLATSLAGFGGASGGGPASNLAGRLRALSDTTARTRSTSVWQLAGYADASFVRRERDGSNLTSSPR